MTLRSFLYTANTTLSLILAVAVVYCGACGGPSWRSHVPVSPRAIPMVVYADGSLEECQVDALKGAAELWNQAALRRYRYLPEDFELVIIDTENYPEGPIQPGVAVAVSRPINPPVSGETLSFNTPLGMRANGLISMRPGCYLALRLAAHELGHLLGRGHSQNEMSVMYPILETGPWDILPEDAESLLPEAGSVRF